jgi:hypothetical protein
MTGGGEPARKNLNPTATVAAAGARTRSEGATLVFAATAAVALGVGCGIWINSLMASSAGRAAQPRPEPAPAVEVRRAGHEDPPAASREAEASQGSVETAGAVALKIEPEEKKDAGRASRRDEDAAHAAREVSPSPKAEARQGVAPGAGRGRASGRGQVSSSRCALYASAGSLTMRVGGAAPLVLGGPGEAGRVTVSTPDWSNIAVLHEGRAGNGWLRYTVRSVSGRPGVYTVRFAAPCGSKTIPVTVR